MTTWFSSGFLLGFHGAGCRFSIRQSNGKCNTADPIGKTRSGDMRGKAEFVNGFSLIKDLISVFQNLCLTRQPNQNHYRPRSIPKEGRVAIATNAGWNAMDVVCAARRAAQRGRQRRVVLTPPGWRQSVQGDDLRATVTQKSWTPGRARRSLLTPSRRECR
jgi:hypothetical protein